MVRRRLALAYLVLLVTSHVVAALHPARPRPGSDQQLAVLGDGTAVVYADLGPQGAAPIVLLHGSPGSGEDLRALALALADGALADGALADGRRVIVPDLPGFGGSRQELDDISIAFHARAVAGLLDHLHLPDAHVVGFSLGGGVALLLPPQRLRSLTLLASVGVQELELFGDHDSNHLAHQAQYALALAAAWLLPHFGAFDTAFAKNFLDSDQRPLRERLAAFDGPTLIVHGEHDVLVPIAAAREHARLVPQSELLVLDQNHFLPWTASRQVAGAIGGFVDRVEAGQGRRRADADLARLARAGEPFVPAPISGAAAGLALLAIAAATLVSEDLACIGTGFLVASGRLGFVPGTAACMAGIFVGDLLLFLAGRLLGRAALRRAPLRWWLSAAAVERASAWFARRGLRAILLSRFTPGLRLPTYFAAGVLRTSLPRFTAYFALAVVVWTPLLVGLSMFIGRRAGTALLIALAVLIGVRLLLRLATWRGRRLLVGSWRRLLHWEFWPPWAFYPPVALYVGLLALRHRSLALVTAVNPGIPAGGFIGESKHGILRELGDAAAPFVVVRADESEDSRRERVRAAGLAPPLVLKPDVGQRGLGVAILRDAAALDGALRHVPADMIVQAFVPGREFGVFYARRPGEDHGAILSITDKRLPELVGDGRRTLEELILADARAVCMASTYCAANAARLLEVPAAGERVTLVQVGTHCRGAIFLDGAALRTPAMEAAFERIARRFPGFHFGRFDVRAPSAEALQQGRDISVIELNGLTSEMTHVYDPRISVFTAWRTLFGQWRLAFEIARANVARGARPARLRELAAALADFRRHARTLAASEVPLAR